MISPITGTYEEFLVTLCPGTLNQLHLFICQFRDVGRIKILLHPIRFGRSADQYCELSPNMHSHECNLRDHQNTMVLQPLVEYLTA
jgi:hypothetical protein